MASENSRKLVDHLETELRSMYDQFYNDTEWRLDGEYEAARKVLQALDAVADAVADLSILLKERYK